MAGLKEYWDLGDPAVLDPAVLQRIASAREAFLAAIGQVNVALQYIAANAPETRHDQLASRREKLFALYQKVVSSQGNDARAVEGLVIHAGRLRDEASELANSTQRWKELWERQAETLDATEDAAAETSDDDQQATQVRDNLARASEAAIRRDYETACGVLQSAAGAAKRIDATAESAPGGGAAVNEKRYPLSGAADVAPDVPADRRELESWKNPLIQGDPRELFDPEKMDAVADMHFQGESTPDDPALNEAMKAILFADEDEDVSAHVKKIGELRGIDPKIIDQQYQRFRQLREVAKKMEATRGEKPDPTMGDRREEYLETHGDFLGTRSSLRFGQVVGEATGLDPAFAAMLNTTGGMVGPGMDVLAPTDANSPVILHGIFHDAGGYLLNHQNSGPGYTYLPDKQPESGRRGADPYQGQVEGVSYWYERREPDRSILDDIYDADGEQMAYETYVQDPIADAERFAQDVTRDTVEEIGEVLDDARQTNRDAADSLKQTAREAAERIDDAAETAERAVDVLADKARELGIDEETVAETEAAIDQRLHAVREQVSKWDRDAANSINDASQSVDQSIDRMEQWTREAADAADQRISAVAGEAEEAIHQKLVDLGQDEDVVEFARNAINQYGEAKQDLKALEHDIDQQIDLAEAEAREFYNQAETVVRQKLAETEANVEGAVEGLATALDFVIGKLNGVREAAERGVNTIAGELQGSVNLIVDTGLDIRDAAGGVVDSLADSVDEGTDALSNLADSATDFAADRLDRLTNLLG
ncbi:hypothetical protein OAS39_06465 [Pirellulales bacterium]|nr:hypothetical protein [Pirellulales bacterium]